VNAVAAASEHGTIFEVCPTSNYQSGVISDLSQHPINKMIEAGLNATINTDDPAISQIKLSDEYALVCEQNGVSIDVLQKQVILAAQVSFLPAEERSLLVSSLSEQMER
jgi:adenosine deaminase